MKYTFLLPAYKSRFLRETLESIQAQTYKDFTVLVSDDCSPEPIYDIVHPFLQDPRFSYRRNASNIGAENLPDHWNLLLATCHSPYLIMAGDDDIYEPTFLEKMDRLVVIFKDVNLFRCRFDQINEIGEVIRTEGTFKEFEDRRAFVQSLFDENYLHAIGQFIFNTHCLQSVGGFKSFPLAWFSDDATAILCSNNGTAHSSEVLFHFRHSGINISTAKGNTHYDRMKVKAVVLFYRWFRNNGIRVNRKPCRDYCCHMLWGLWGSFSLSEQLAVICTFPILVWMILKERICSAIK